MIAPRSGAGYMQPDGAIALGGARHAGFILRLLSEAMTAAHPGLRFIDRSCGTTSALPLLAHDRILFGSMGRRIDRHEVVSYQKIVGIEPLEIRVAHTSDDTSHHLATSLAVYVNAANPLERMTMQQLSQALTVGNPAGDFSCWGQLGLDGAWRLRAIRPYGTPEYTGFGTTMQRDHFGCRALAPSHSFHLNTDALLEHVALDPAGIAVAALGRAAPGLRQVALAQDADQPFSLGSRDDVASGVYPLRRDLFFYLRQAPDGALDPVARAYTRLILSPQGQAIIASQPGGYVPLQPDTAEAECRKLA